jgi:hypothetical protein
MHISSRFTAKLGCPCVVLRLTTQLSIDLYRLYQLKALSLLRVTDTQGFCKLMNTRILTVQYVAEIAARVAVPLAVMVGSLPDH